MTAPIEVFFWTTPNAWKITLALEEMGLPYAIRPVAIGKGEQFKPEFLAISPNNRVPAIIDHEGPGGHTHLGVRVGRDSAVPRSQDRRVLSSRRAPEGRSG